MGERFSALRTAIARSDDGWVLWFYFVLQSFCYVLLGVSIGFLMVMSFFYAINGSTLVDEYVKYLHRLTGL